MVAAQYGYNNFNHFTMERYSSLPFIDLRTIYGPYTCLKFLICLLAFFANDILVGEPMHSALKEVMVPPPKLYQ